jgi:ADP-heptose:LPS heptosyltransferase
MPGVNLVNLQKGGGKRTWPNLGNIDLREGGEIVPMLDEMDSVENFYDLANHISGLDLVITVDTAVAHLAGAMGVPTWVLLGSYPDFRWLLEREDSPWYPSVRLFRQPYIEKDWEAVFKTVRCELEKIKAN